MSEETLNDDIDATKLDIDNEENLVIPAKLQDGEPVISAEKAEQFKAIIEELVAVEAEEKVDDNVVSTASLPKDSKPKKASLETSESGAISSPGANRKDKPAPTPDKPEVEKVAVYSTRNVTWTGVGKVYRGYNIVTKAEADQWLKRDHIRLATPEEVAKEFKK